MSTMARDAGVAPGVMAGRWDTARAGARLETAGGAILRYGLAAILLYFGVFKFSPVEAEAIRPLVSNSPLMGWMYAILSVQAVSTLIGIGEIVVAGLLLARPWSARAGAIGGAGAAVIFVTTLSFLVTTPGAWASVPGMADPHAGRGGIVPDQGPVPAGRGGVDHGRVAAGGVRPGPLISTPLEVNVRIPPLCPPRRDGLLLAMGGDAGAALGHLWRPPTLAAFRG